MQLQQRRHAKRPSLTIGATFGKWTVLELHGPDARVRCACGTERYQRIATLRHGNSTQCRACRVKESRHEPKLANARPAHVWQTIQSLSQLQMQYAAALIRSRQKIEEEGDQPLTRADVTDAIEMARHLSPAQLEVELKNLCPRYHAEARQSYQLYQSPKGVQL